MNPSLREWFRDRSKVLNAKVEGHNFDIRKHLLDYDDVMNQQRGIIYGLRRNILEGKIWSFDDKICLGDVSSASWISSYLKIQKEDWNLEV